MRLIGINRINIMEHDGMGRGTKTTEFLKECLADALIQLMRAKQYEKISIQEIADKSGVGRATWFRNYNGKNEALTFKLIVLWNRWSDEHNVSVRDRFTLKNSKDFFGLILKFAVLCKRFTLLICNPPCMTLFIR